MWLHALTLTVIAMGSLTQIVAARLQAVRASRAMTQSELAERAGIAVAEISKIENGRRAPRLETLERLAAGLDVEPWELLHANHRIGEPPTGEMALLRGLLEDSSLETRQRAVALIEALTRTL